MTSAGNIILRCDFGNVVFQRSFKALKHDVNKEARRAMGELVLVDVDSPPAKLHLHMLTNKTVPSALDPSKQVKVYTFHITSNDAWKASFTLENGTAFLRACGPHDKIDKTP